MDFFDPPMIALQKSKFVETDDGYLCRTKTKTCSLNLILSGDPFGLGNRLAKLLFQIGPDGRKARLNFAASHRSRFRSIQTGNRNRPPASWNDVNPVNAICPCRGTKICSLFCPNKVWCAVLSCLP